MNQIVSIIIPAYNSKKWIGDCIQSAIDQTYNPKEIIVVDDGSTDSTLKTAKSYESSMVKVVRQTNKGASAARNLGLQSAQGEWIQWLDADDILDPSKIETQMAHANDGLTSKVLYSCSWGKFYNNFQNAQFKPDVLWADLEPYEWLYSKIEGNLWMPPMVFLVSRWLTEESGDWNIDLARDNDGEYFCRVISKAEKIKFIENAKCYKRSTFGISSQLTFSDKKCESLSYSLKNYIDTLRRMEDSVRTRNACLSLLNRWAIYFYPERADLLQELQLVASDLGGKISVPELRPKYRWMQRIIGIRLAKKVQFSLPAIRSIFEKYSEKV